MPPELITPARLGTWPLPQPEGETDKNSRGRLLLIGGSAEMPGPLVLAATAAFRSGAGKVRVATVASVAPFIGVAVPEARVFALPETEAGAIDPAAAERLGEYARGVDAVVLGPGMIDQDAVQRLVDALLPRLERPALLDAEAMLAAARNRDALRRATGPFILTPNPGEAASITGRDQRDVTENAPAIALRLAADVGAVVSLKGAATHIADAQGALFHYHSYTPGLGISGSGDVLAGVIGGLLAQGAATLQAAVWATYLHGEAGRRLAARIGQFGFLARELPAELPHVLAALTPPGLSKASA